MRRTFFLCLIACIQVILNQNTFAGEGHDAGRKWAEENGMTTRRCRSRYQVGGKMKYKQLAILQKGA